MKKFLLLLACIFTWTLASAEVADKRIKFNNLPQTAQQFIKKHFPNQKVVSVEMDDDRTYEVRLAGDIQIDFSKSGRWTEIESERKGIPYSALPERVRRKVSAKYPKNVKVVEIERDREEIEVKLSNGQELKFKNRADKKVKNYDDDDDDLD